MLVKYQMYLRYSMLKRVLRMDHLPYLPAVLIPISCMFICYHPHPSMPSRESVEVRLRKVKFVWERALKLQITPLFGALNMSPENSFTVQKRARNPHVTAVVVNKQLSCLGQFGGFYPRFSG